MQQKIEEFQTKLSNLETENASQLSKLTNLNYLMLTRGNSGNLLYYTIEKNGIEKSISKINWDIKKLKKEIQDFELSIEYNLRENLKIEIE